VVVTASQRPCRLPRGIFLCVRAAATWRLRAEVEGFVLRHVAPVARTQRQPAASRASKPEWSWLQPGAGLLQPDSASIPRRSRRLAPLPLTPVPMRQRIEDGKVPYGRGLSLFAECSRLALSHAGAPALGVGYPTPTCCTSFNCNIAYRFGVWQRDYRPRCRPAQTPSPVRPYGAARRLCSKSRTTLPVDNVRPAHYLTAKRGCP
jgi:hypothetical protein